MHPAVCASSPKAATPDRAAGLIQLTAHLMLAVVVVGTLGRLVVTGTELCWTVAPPALLLMTGYGVGVALWDRMSTWARHLWLWALVALWWWTSWVLPAELAFGYAWLAIPLAIAALRMFDGPVAVLVVAVITALLVGCLVRMTGTVRLDLVAPPVTVLWAAVALYRGQQRLVEELRRTRAELAQQQHEIGRAAERTRIAGDLHDSLVQELAGNRMLLQAAARNWERRPEAAKLQVQAVTEALGASLADTRSILRDLASPALEDDSLATALQALCTRRGGAAEGPLVVFRSLGPARDAPPEQASALLRVVQGLLANACEHARADHVWVTLDYRDERTLAVEIRDDGIGFDPTSPRAGRATADDGCRGFGLSAVRGRLAAHGGTFAVDTAHGRGTRIMVTLPTGVPVLASR